MPDYLRVDLGSDRPPLKFKTRDELTVFLDAEVQFANLAIGNIGAHLKPEMVGALKALRAALRTLQNDPDHADKLQTIENYLRTYALSGFPCPPSPERALLESLGEPAGAMQAAMYILYGNPGSNPRGEISAQSWEIGSFAATALHFGVAPQGKPIAREASVRQQAENDRIIGKLAADVASLEKQFEATLTKSSTELANVRTYAISRIRFFRLLRKRSVERTKAAIDEIHKVYREQMLLQEPVQYWRNKELEHIGKSNRWLAVLVVTAALVVALPTLAGWLMLNPASGEIGLFALLKPSTAAPSWGQLLRDAKGLAIIALTSGLTVWALRFASRVYLSERHLATDARERQTVVMTYIALIKEGAASEAERAIVLQTLFRASGDGIVKDDAGMDPSLVGLLGKIIDRK